MDQQVVLVAVSSPTCLPVMDATMSATTSPVHRRPAGVSCAVFQNHVALALAHFPIGRRAVIANESVGVGLRQPAAILAASEPSQRRRPLGPLPIGAAPGAGGPRITT